MSNESTEIVIAASNKITVGGAVTTGASAVVNQTGAVELIGVGGMQIVEVCAVVGASATVVGVAVNVLFQILRYRRDAKK